VATLLLNTIALDPNRWTPDKTPYYRLVDLLPAVAEAGFHRLEVWQYHLSTLDAEGVTALQECAQELRITSPVVGLYPALHVDDEACEQEWAQHRRLLDEAAHLGAEAVKIFAGQLGSAEVDDAAYDRSIAFARRLAEAAAGRSLALHAETHPDTLCDSVAACRRFLADVDAPNLRLCFQPFDFSDTARAVADVEALHEHIAHVHLQGRRDDRMCLLERAEIDYGPVFGALAAHGFDGALCIEFVEDCVVETPADFDLNRVLANAQRDRAFIEQITDEVGLALG
jgi:sugar phosphate isomerase/epimerase